MMTRTKPRSSL